MCLCRRDVQDLVLREAASTQRLLNLARRHERNALLCLPGFGWRRFLLRLRFGHRPLKLWLELRGGLRPHFGGGRLGFGFAWRRLALAFLILACQLTIERFGCRLGRYWFGGLRGRCVVVERCQKPLAVIVIGFGGRPA